MKKIEQMYTPNIEDGKDYLLLQMDGITLKTGIVTARITTIGKPFITSYNINFEMKSGDLNPGRLENIVFMAEVD